MGETPSLREFTLAFFRNFGAQIQRQDQRRNGAVLVTLPPELAEHFGKPQLLLVFQNAEVTSETDLVAYGSRVFDRMVAYLEQRGATLLQRLPVRFPGADELLRAVRPVNGAIRDLKLAQRDHLLCLFNWHITYRADDKKEEIFSVLLDENGQRLPVTDEHKNEAEGETEDGVENPAGDGFHPQALLAHAQPVEPIQGPDGQPLPPKLPPMTHLVRWAETARKYALYHADVRCVAHEAEILPRLHKVLARLTTYYEQQIEEIYDSHDPEGEKRQALEEDLQRKIAEEVENHRLRVQVRLFSYGVFRAPVAQADLLLSDGRQEVPVQVVRNLYTGAIRRPRCHACGQETETVVLCRNGHVSCQECMAQCQSCQDVLCAACGVETCPVCQQANCDRCGQTCWACGERACTEHISRCPVCGDDVCHACQAECSQCGVRQCRSHLRADSVTDALICAECAVRCPGCSQYSVHMATCAVSGQRFCQNCIVTCAGCGKLLGPGFYQLDPLDQQPYCQECLQACPTCGTLVGRVHLQGCSVCGAPVCGACGVPCGECGELSCPEHSAHCHECGKPLCQEHTLTCSVGGEPLCASCGALCPICGQPTCQQHMAVCHLCGQRYCQECVHESSQLCDTCVALPNHGEEVAIREEPVIQDPRVANLAGKHRWRRHGNQRYTLYLGSNLWGSHVLVVAEGEKVLRIRRSTLLTRLLGEGWQ